MKSGDENTGLTMVADARLVEELWSNQECPYFDLIMYRDGRVLSLIMFEEDILGSATMRSDSCIPVSEIADIHEKNTLNEGFASMYKIAIPDFGITVSCGECFAAGQNGFVAVSNTSSGELIWLAYFVDSNPFEMAKIKDDVLICQSTDGRIFRFKLNEPDNVTITQASS